MKKAESEETKQSSDTDSDMTQTLILSDSNLNSYDSYERLQWGKYTI